MKMTESQISLYKKIDEILWEDWDPIGINLEPQARDEYYGYLPQIFTLKNNEVDKFKIAQYLFKVETENMGLNGNMETCIKVAEKISRL